MSVLNRQALESSPLADLHTIASELSLDGYRRLRKADLVDRILARQGAGGTDAASEPDSETEAALVEDDRDERSAAEAAEPGEEEKPTARRRRSRRGGRGRSGTRDEEERSTESDREADPEPTAEETQPAPAPAGGPEKVVEGTVELLSNGSGFVRVSPPDPSDGDVYVSAAQIKRCELVSGDRISGPRRAPRRSERFASLVRIDTINGSPAAELVSGTRFDDLPAAFPSERFHLSSEDPTLRAVEFLAPFGRGSRVTIVGGARAGKTETLRRLAPVLCAQEDLQVSVVLAGARPEEISEWSSAEPAPAAAVSFAASADAQDQAVELVIDQARRAVARGADAVVLIDTLDWLHPQAKTKVLAAARNIVDGGSLTVIATSSAPIGGETTVIALDPALTGSGRFPALDLAASGTLRPELLVGESGAQAIAAARVEVLGES